MKLLSAVQQAGLKPSFRVRPKGLYAVNMAFVIGKFILSMPACRLADRLDPIVFFIANVHQSIIASPLIRMNNAFGRHFAPNNGLQRGFGAVRHNLCIDLASSLKDAEYRCFAISTSSPFAFVSFCSKIRFVNFPACRQTGISPLKGEFCSQNSAILFLIMFTYLSA